MKTRILAALLLALPAALRAGPGPSAPAPKLVAKPAPVDPKITSKLIDHLFDHGEESVLEVNGKPVTARCLHEGRAPGGPGKDFRACLEVAMVLPKCPPDKPTCAVPAVLRFKIGDIILIDEDWQAAAKTPAAAPRFSVSHWVMRLSTDSVLDAVSVTIFETAEKDAGPQVGTLYMLDPSQAAVQLIFKAAAQRALRLFPTVLI